MNTNDDFLEFLYDYVGETLAETEEKLKDIQEVIEKLRNQD